MATSSVQSEAFARPILPFAPETTSDGGHDGEIVSLDQYLHTLYRPDCDYVDGHLEERHMGEFDHNRVQKRLLILFSQKETDWQIECIQEQRLQVAPASFRVPDLMVLRGIHYPEQIVRIAPLLIIEVLSPEDTLKRLYEKVEDYLHMGVRHIWAFDPYARIAYRCDVTGFHIVPKSETELTVPETSIRLNLADVFSTLDR